MGPLANRNYREWTEGLDTRQSMIAIFSRIRDIPYALVAGPGYHTPDDSAETMLREGQGSCAPKHYLLAAMFRRLNLSVVYATFPFRWGEQEFRYPPALRDEVAGLPVAYHLACRVKIGCRFALVDATWDPPLEKAGFPVNLHWDGIAQTRCAVLPLRSHVCPVPAGYRQDGPCRDAEQEGIVPPDNGKDHREAEDRQSYCRKNGGKPVLEDTQRTTRFYRGLNAWMEQVRDQAG